MSAKNEMIRTGKWLSDICVRSKRCNNKTTHNTIEVLHKMGVDVGRALYSKELNKEANVRVQATSQRKYDEWFMDNFAKLNMWISQGDGNKMDDFETLCDDDELKDFVDKIMRSSRNDTLDKKYVHMMDAIKFPWRPFNENFQLLCSYYAEHGNMNVDEQGDNEDSTQLCKFVKNMRSLREKGKLDKVKETMLTNIGFQWDTPVEMEQAGRKASKNDSSIKKGRNMSDGRRSYSNAYSDNSLIISVTTPTEKRTPVKHIRKYNSVENSCDDSTRSYYSSIVQKSTAFEHTDDDDDDDKLMEESLIDIDDKGLIESKAIVMVGDQKGRSKNKKEGTSANMVIDTSDEEEENMGNAVVSSCSSQSKNKKKTVRVQEINDEVIADKNGGVVREEMVMADSSDSDDDSCKGEGVSEETTVSDSDSSGKKMSTNEYSVPMLDYADELGFPLAICQYCSMKSTRHYCATPQVTGQRIFNDTRICGKTFCDKCKVGNEMDSTVVCPDCYAVEVRRECKKKKEEQGIFNMDKFKNMDVLNKLEVHELRRLCKMNKIDFGMKRKAGCVKLLKAHFNL